MLNKYNSKLAIPLPNVFMNETVCIINIMRLKNWWSASRTLFYFTLPN